MAVFKPITEESIIKALHTVMVLQLYDWHSTLMHKGL